MYYERTYKARLLHLSRFFPVVTLCGARQSGKTTLIRETFPSYQYVSLDLPSLAAMAENNPDEFFSANKAPLIIDEVQYAPGLFRHIKRMVDTRRHAMGQYILTGSQKFNLMKEVSDSLAGRSIILDLENLSWQEKKPLLNCLWNSWCAASFRNSGGYAICPRRHSIDPIFQHIWKGMYGRFSISPACVILNGS